MTIRVIKKDSSKTKASRRPTLKAISVEGFKSLEIKQRMEIAPLTVLAGANSGGKSSIMQPVLLLKQTIDAPYDPGSLLLDGPNVRLTSADQLLSKRSNLASTNNFSIEFEIGDKTINLCFHKVPRKGLEIFNNSVIDGKTKIVIPQNAEKEELDKIVASSKYDEFFPKGMLNGAVARIVRDRSFLSIEMVMEEGRFALKIIQPGELLSNLLANLIHVPGLRGNPERNYKTTAVGKSFPGTFENYVASVINHWQSNKDKRLSQLGMDLESLGLTWKVMAEQRDETQVELKVGRLQHSLRGGAHDLVSIADVGFGVSQTLPVLVALLVAEPGQLVYIEQPEIHLHPSAQRALANVFASAAKRGVIVIIETHSALLLRGIQTLVAKNELNPDLVKLHWFERDASSGATTITTSDLDDAGAFGDWPEDFDDVELKSENDYLSAAEAKLLKRKSKS